MKGQSRIEFRARKSRISNSETANVKNIEDKQLTKSFRPMEHIVSKPQKVEKPVARKSSRLASKDLKQTVLDLKTIERSTTNKPTIKRKIETATNKAADNKKLKQYHDESSKDIEAEKRAATTEINVEKTEDESFKEIEIATAEIESTMVAKDADTAADVNKVDSPTEASTSNGSLVENEKTEPKDENHTVESFESDIKGTPVPHIQEEDALSIQDTLSPPSSFIEPMTPPRQTYTAPYKEYMTEADKQRIEYEKSTLEKLRKSLDIVITDRAARNQPTLYHQIEAVLRNSIRRTITLSHICQIMYITPNLYTLEAKEIRSFGGKVTEAFLIQFTKDWCMPLAGKDLQERADILRSATTQYFVDHPEPEASIPEKTLPRLDLVLDKKEWLKEAQLPSGVRKLLEAHEKAKEAEIEREKPKPKPTGSVKDRMAALRARLAKKSG